MQGLALCEAYFWEVGYPALQRACPEALPQIACGLAGDGSDCFGYDDEISRDHDWGPGFSIWLREEDAAACGEKLRRIYSALPGEFGGYASRNATEEGKGRVGVTRIGDFYRQFTGKPEGPDTLMDWLSLPETYLAAATNGKVFLDHAGAFSRIREKLLAYYPEDVRIKKLQARMAKMAQAGQYNYGRCLERGEAVAAQLALGEFIRIGISAVYLLSRRYMPYYKWAHRGLKDLPVLPGMYTLFGRLVKTREEDETKELIETICAGVLEETSRQGLCEPGRDDFLLAYCGQLSEHIEDGQIKALHWMVG